MNLNDTILAIREGGQTQRCHTMQYFGPYNVAIHSYNALSLLLGLYPGKPSINLIRAVQWHDIPERWTGDIPTPAKLCSSTFRGFINDLETKVLRALGLGDLFDLLTTKEREWLEAVDLLELFIWAREQAVMGNGSVERMNEQILKIFWNKWDKVPIEVQKFIENFKWHRSVECNELEGINE